ncbi:AMP-binding protein [Rhodococcus sp. (in: high G+C Gram-positive bacteria)]|uniref:AMP-binding protein n=1 Tax=Rhodococcus sp. TaxID=1831 RepID=UPI00257A049F|nr:AMP-binding protein [Rhodococcus sp. (in: high G+C Gram-positive bacteria)]MBQ7805726.1 AMP-binding protein [Rhodococcus sp. (in: high G+C Gram-positive bacteria)]
MLSTLTADVPVDRIAETLRIAVAGGSALPAEVHRNFESRFGVTIVEGYGLSETSPLTSFNVYGEAPVSAPSASRFREWR